MQKSAKESFSLVFTAVLLGGMSLCGSASARITHDGTCPSGYALETAGQRACISPQRITHDVRCPGAAVVADGAMQCLALDSAAAPPPLASVAAPVSRPSTPETGQPLPPATPGTLEPKPDLNCASAHRVGGVCVDPQRITHDVRCRKPSRLALAGPTELTCLEGRDAAAVRAARAHITASLGCARDTTKAAAATWNGVTVCVGHDRLLIDRLCPSGQAVVAFGAATCVSPSVREGSHRRHRHQRRV